MVLRQARDIERGERRRRDAVLGAAQQAASRRNLVVALSFSAILLFMLGLVGFVTVRSIVKRLAKLHAVSSKLAVADVEGLAIDISGRDEIGEFGESMRGVHAAIEELLHAAQAPAAVAA